MQKYDLRIETPSRASIPASAAVADGVARAGWLDVAGRSPAHSTARRPAAIVRQRIRRVRDLAKDSRTTPGTARAAGRRSSSTAARRSAGVPPSNSGAVIPEISDPGVQA
jgi:hypothetical protein